MIQELREYSDSLFFKLLLAFISVTFVISFGVGSFLGDRKEVLAKVDDSEILLKDYQRSYNNQLKNIRQNLGKNAEKFAESVGLRQRVLDQLINQELLLNSAKQQGFLLTDLELQGYIRQQQFFQSNNQFDFNTYKTVLSQNRITLVDYEKSLRKELLLKKFQNVFSGGVLTTDAELDAAYRQENEQTDVQYLNFPADHFLSEVQLSEDALKQYHQGHSLDFQSNPQYRIEYFVLNLDLFTHPDKVKEREIRRYYKRNQTDYGTPPEVKARHILFKNNKDLSQKEKDLKRQQLEELRSKIQNGASFEALAKEFSEDMTAMNGGDLGWFKSGEMVPAFEKAAFALNPGEVSEIVDSPFGMHLIQVDEKKEAQQKDLESVREEIISILAEKRAQKQLDENFNKLDLEMRNQPLQSFADSLNTPLKTTKWFDQYSSVSGLGSSQSLATELGSKEKGDTGILKRNPVQGYVFYRLLEKKAPSPLTFAEARSGVEQALKYEEAKKIAQKRAEDSLVRLQSGEKLDSLAQEYGLELSTLSVTPSNRNLDGIGKNPEFQKAALSLNQNKKFALSLSENRVDLIHFQARKLDTTDQASRKQKILDRLTQTWQQTLITKEIQRLRESSSIDILNPLFKKPQA